jgi:glycosyltransferase involved in cell wall biosynthesis
MRPLHIIEVLEATAGGTRRHLRDLVLGLDRHRFRLTVIASLARDPDFARDLDLFRKAGVAVHVLPMKRRIAPLGDAVALVRLIRLVRSLHPDVIHAHSSKAGLLARLAARAAGGVPAVYTPHAFAFLSDSPWRGLYLACERWASRWTGRLIAVSREEYAWACDGARGLGLPADRVRLIPNGIEAGGVPSVPERPHPVIGFVGRMSRQKGSDLFLDVARRIRDARPDVRFLMVGDGPWLARVERRLRRTGFDACVRLRTARDEIEVAGHLADMDAVVLPSRWEGLPYTLLEAMAAGVPVVASAVGGIADVIESGVSGLLGPVGDVESLATGALAMVNDRMLADRIRSLAHERLGAYTLRTMIDRVETVYEELTNDEIQR